MKIEELSIGDWVSYDKCSDPVRILGIDSRIGKCVVMTDSCYTRGVIGFIENVHPIPLTPEILEKNGFVKNGEYNEWNIGTWYTPNLVGVSLDRPSIIVNSQGSSIFLDQAKAVHQLQHALRLAGIEKEIEL